MRFLSGCFPIGFLAEYGPKVSKGERREAGIQWIQPPQAVSAPEFRQTTSGAHVSAGRADCLPRGKPFGAPAGAYPYPIGTPTPRRGAGGERKAPCQHDKRQLCRKQIPLAGPDAPTPAREEGLQPYGALTCFRRRSEGGAGGRADSHPACIMGNNFAAGNSLLAGIDAPTPARIGTGRPKGRSHFSFGGERKVYKRKPAARRLQRRPAPLRVIRKYRRSGHCRARPLYLLRPVSR